MLITDVLLNDYMTTNWVLSKITYGRSINYSVAP